MQAPLTDEAHLIAGGQRSEFLIEEARRLALRDIGVKLHTHPFQGLPLLLRRFFLPPRGGLHGRLRDGELPSIVLTDTHCIS